MVSTNTLLSRFLFFIVLLAAGSFLCSCTPKVFGGVKRDRLKGIERVAFLPFKTPKGTPPGLGKSFAEELAARCTEIPFIIVECAQLRKVLKEQELSLAGIIDEKTASEIGKILGVDAVFNGRVITYHDYYINPTRNTELSVSVRLVDSTTAELLLTAYSTGVAPPAFCAQEMACLREMMMREIGDYIVSFF